MNKVYFLRIISLATFLISLTFCSSTEKKDEQPPTKEEAKTEDFDAKAAKESAAKRTDSEVAVVEEPKKTVESGESESTETQPMAYGELLEELSSKIKEIRYPDGQTIEGFAYKRWDIPNQKDFVNWLKTSASVIRDVLEKLPETVKLEIIGHADTSGPETQEGNKLGNIYYSEKRAEEVKKYIVKVFKSEKLNAKNLEARIITKGVGSSQPLPDVEGTSAKNRRVTFNIVDTASGEEKSGEADSELNSTK